MSNRFKCYLCNVEVSRQSFPEHFFSRGHLPEYVVPALKKNKDDIAAYKKASKKSSLPSIYIKNDTATIQPCFGCKTVKQFQDREHLETCPKAEEHCNFMKKHFEDSEAVEEDIGALKKKLRRALEEIEDVEKDRDQGEEERELMVTFWKAGKTYQEYLDR